jgi:hypothetical protein
MFMNLRSYDGHFAPAMFQGLKEPRLPVGGNIPLTIKAL